MPRTLASITGTGTVSTDGVVQSTEGFIAEGPMCSVYSFTLVSGGGSATARLHNAANATAVGTMAIVVAATNTTSPDVISGGAVLFNKGIRCIINGTGLVAHVVYD